MKKMKIQVASGECELLIGESIEHLSSYCNAERMIIVTDKNVHGLHGKRFPHAEVIEIGQGEEAKTLETVHRLYERFLKLELDRSSMVVGIGGGIVCDVTGFAASTYLRGLRFGFVPTTLLAQVDASVGGKNGVNFQGYKNLIGTIRQPEFCLMDFEALKTLPVRELRNGLAEIAKCGAISNVGLFAYLEQHFADILALKKIAVEKVVYDSLTVKVDIVQQDESEKGERMKLNFGHTLGHALENTAGVSHGKAVSIGMVAAAHLSVQRGLLPRSEAERLISLLDTLGLPTRMEVDMKAVLDAIHKDKKRRGEEINMVLLESIGNAVVQKIPLEEVEGVLHDI